VWIAIDGPAGTGKSTTTDAVAGLLTAGGQRVHRTQQPSRSSLGTFIRDALDTLDGYPLACLLAADRYAQVRTEIQPALATGFSVVCDRYVPSAALDLVRGVSPDVVWKFHASLPLPDLMILLTATVQVAVDRIGQRGAHSRWQTEDSNAEHEARAYQTVTEHLQGLGWPILTIDTDANAPDEIARTVVAAAHTLTRQL
jgi:dTMP kinase